MKTQGLLRRLMAATVVVFALGLSVGSAGAVRRPTHAAVEVRLRPGVIDLLHTTSVSVTGVSARGVEVRLLGGIDRAGLAYQWTPYPWRRLRLHDGSWTGVLGPPALLGIYRLQLRLDDRGTRLSSAGWLLRVFPRETVTRDSFPTAFAAIRDFVGHLPGDQVLVALRRWPQAGFDHRDPRLHRLFVLAYARRGDGRPSARLGLFVTTVRDGAHGRWRVLEASVQPYD